MREGDQERGVRYRRRRLTSVSGVQVAAEAYKIESLDSHAHEGVGHPSEEPHRRHRKVHGH